MQTFTLDESQLVALKYAISNSFPIGSATWREIMGLLGVDIAAELRRTASGGATSMYTACRRRV